MGQWHEISANRRAFVYILFSLIALGAIFIAGIAPVKQQTADLEKMAVKLEAQIEKQVLFQPLYRRIAEGQRQQQQVKKAVFAVETQETLLGIGIAPIVLSTMANQDGIYESRFSPAPDSVASDSDLLLIEGVLQGQYTHFKDFLMRLANLPAFHSFETLVVRSTTSFPEYRVKVWVEID